MRAPGTGKHFAVCTRTHSPNQMPESSCGGFSLSWKTKLPQPRGRTLTLSKRGKHLCPGRLGDRRLQPREGHHHRCQRRPHTGVCAAARKSMEAGGRDRSGSCDSLTGLQKQWQGDGAAASGPRPNMWGAQHTEALQGPVQTGRRPATGGPYTAQSSGHRSQGTEPSGFPVQWGGSYNTTKAQDFCVHMEDVKCTSQKILTCSWSGPGFSTAAWSTSQGARVKEAWHSAAQCQGPQACHQAGPRSDRPKEYTRHFPQH